MNTKPPLSAELYFLLGFLTIYKHTNGDKDECFQIIIDDLIKKLSKD